jgi:hypothetical protein
MKALLTKLLLVLLRGYQLAISPLLGQSCRFYPTCSNYAMEAIRKHGPLKGVMLAAVRLGKCHPWHPGGNDPVPKKEGSQAGPGPNNPNARAACGCSRH